MQMCRYGASCRGIATYCIYNHPERLSTNDQDVSNEPLENPSSSYKSDLHATQDVSEPLSTASSIEIDSSVDNITTECDVTEFSQLKVTDE